GAGIDVSLLSGPEQGVMVIVETPGGVPGVSGLAISRLSTSPHRSGGAASFLGPFLKNQSLLEKSLLSASGTGARSALTLRAPRQAARLASSSTQRLYLSPLGSCGGPGE